MSAIKDLLLDYSSLAADHLNELHDMDATEEEVMEAVINHPEGTNIVLKKNKSFKVLDELKAFIIKERGNV